MFYNKEGLIQHGSNLQMLFSNQHTLALSLFTYAGWDESQTCIEQALLYF